MERNDGRSVRITVTGRDADGEPVSLCTRGTLQDIPGGFALRYEETSLHDMETTDTLVECVEGRVTVSRSGTMLSTIVFDAQETFVGDYPTPHGNFQLRVLPSEVAVARRGDLGRIRLVYQINLSAQHAITEETFTRSLEIRFTP